MTQIMFAAAGFILRFSEFPKAFKKKVHYDHDCEKRSLLNMLEEKRNILLTCKTPYHETTSSLRVETEISLKQ